MSARKGISHRRDLKDVANELRVEVQQQRDRFNERENQVSTAIRVLSNATLWTRGKSIERAIEILVGVQ